MTSIPGEDEITVALGVPKVISFEHEAKRRNKFRCQGKLHQRFVVDTMHGTVHCAECEEVVSAFHALTAIATNESLFRRQMHSIMQEYRELAGWRPWLKITKALERLWRGEMAPCCPHCSEALLPEDMVHMNRVNANMERRRREASKR